MSLTMKTFIEIEPTTSPSDCCARRPPEARRCPSTWRERRAGAARYAPSSTLSATPTAVRRERAEQPFGAALRDPARSRSRISSVSAAPARRRSAPGARASRARIRSGVLREQRRPCRASGSGERRYAAAVDADLRAADELGDPLLQRVRSDRGTDGAASRARGRRRASRRACRSSCGRASRPAGLPAGRSRGRRPSTPARASTLRDGRELRGLGAVRRARDRDLVVAEVVVALDERDRLHRLQRRSGSSRRSSGSPHALAGGRADVDAVHRLDGPAAPHGYADRVHRRGSLTLPELPEVEAWRRQLDPLVEAVADRAGGAGPHRDAEDVRPAGLRRSTGEGLRGVERRAKRFLLPTDDGELVLMVHLMSAGRLKYVPPGGEGREDADVPAAVRRRRRAAADRGRVEEARRRLAAAPGRRSRPSSRTSGRRQTS